MPSGASSYRPAQVAGDFSLQRGQTLRRDVVTGDVFLVHNSGQANPRGGSIIYTDTKLTQAQIDGYMGGPDHQAVGRHISDPRVEIQERVDTAIGDIIGGGAGGSTGDGGPSDLSPEAQAFVDNQQRQNFASVMYGDRNPDTGHTEAPSQQFQNFLADRTNTPEPLQMSGQNGLSGGAASRRAAMTGDRQPIQLTQPTAVGPPHPRDNGRTQGPTAGMAAPPGSTISSSPMGGGYANDEERDLAQARMRYQMWGRGTVAETGPRPPNPDAPTGGTMTSGGSGLPGKGGGQAVPSPPTGMANQIEASGQPQGPQPGGGGASQGLPSKSSGAQQPGQMTQIAPPSAGGSIQQGPATPAAGQSIK